MLSYVNNKFCSLDKAQISVNDRGYQFGDAVYEVIFYKNGNFLDLEGHLKRLRKSTFSLIFTSLNPEFSNKLTNIFLSSP